MKIRTPIQGKRRDLGCPWDENRRELGERTYHPHESSASFLLTSLPSTYPSLLNKTTIFHCSEFRKVDQQDLKGELQFTNALGAPWQNADLITVLSY